MCHMLLHKEEHAWKKNETIMPFTENTKHEK